MYGIIVCDKWNVYVNTYNARSGEQCELNYLTTPKLNKKAALVSNFSRRQWLSNHEDFAREAAKVCCKSLAHTAQNLAAIDIIIGHTTEVPASFAFAIAHTIGKFRDIGDELGVENLPNLRVLDVCGVNAGYMGGLNEIISKKILHPETGYEREISSGICVSACYEGVHA